MPHPRRSFRVLVTVIVGALVAATAATAAGAPSAAADSRGVGVVSGTVRDTDGAGLADAVVRAIDLDSFAVVARTRSRADGRFRFVLPAGDYYVGVSGTDAHGGNSDATGYVGNAFRANVAPGVTVDHETALHAGAAVSGRVTDTEGRPLGGVEAYLGPVWPYVDVINSGIFSILSLGFDGGGAYTRNDGSYTIRGIVPGVYLSCFEASSHPVRGGSSDAAGYLSTCSQATLTTHRRVTTRAGGSALTAAEGGAITGTVRDASGLPLRRASVDLVRGSARYPSAYLTTDGDGRFTALGLAPDTYRVCSQGEYAADHASTGSARTCRTQVRVRAGATASIALDLRLGGVVTGTVRSVTGEPVVGGFVRTGRDYDARSGTTDEHGRFRIAGVLPGAHAVCVDTTYATVPGSPGGALAGCRTSAVRVHAGAVRDGVVVTLRAGGGIAGVLRDTTGAPIQNAEIDVSSRNSFGFASPHRDGSYAIRGLATGDYQLCVDAYTPGSGAQVSCRDHPVHVVRGAIVRGMDFTFRPGGTVGVRVEDGDGHPIAGANAVLLKACGRNDFCDVFRAFDPHRYLASAASWITDQRGEVTFANVLPGTYAVCSLGFHAATAHDTSPTGYADTCTDLDVQVEVGASRHVEQVLHPGGVVTGTVTDEAGEPIRNAIVHVTGSPEDDVPYNGSSNSPTNAYRTASDGTVTIPGVRGGQQHVCVDARDAKGSSAGGFLDRCLADPVTVTVGDTVDFGTVHLAAGGAITGEVSGLTGRYAEVAILVFGGGAGLSDDPPFLEHDGSYRVDRLVPGTYRVCFEPSGGTSAAQCYDDVPWNDDGRHQPPLADATPLTVTAGTVVTGIDATLHPK